MPIMGREQAILRKLHTAGDITMPSPLKRLRASTVFPTDVPEDQNLLQMSQQDEKDLEEWAAISTNTSLDGFLHSGVEADTAEVSPQMAPLPPSATIT